MGAIFAFSEVYELYERVRDAWDIQCSVYRYLLAVHRRALYIAVVVPCQVLDLPEVTNKLYESTWNLQDPTVPTHGSWSSRMYARRAATLLCGSYEVRGVHVWRNSWPACMYRGIIISSPLGKA